MPKKLYAVTNVKTSLPGQDATFFTAGSEVDPSKFTKEQLVELHENGAVEVRVVEDEEVTQPEETTNPEENHEPIVTDKPTGDPAKEIAPGEDPQARIEEANSSDANVDTDAMSKVPDEGAEDNS